jgi:hypothetical protein
MTTWADAQARLTAERDCVERAKVSEEIGAAVRTIEAHAEPTLSAMREVANALTALDHVQFEVGQLGRFLAGAAGEAEIALAVVAPELHRLTTAIREGSAPIPSKPGAAHLVPSRRLRPRGTRPLFYDPARSRGGSDANPHYKKVGERIAEWVRSLGIDVRVAPNHGWRHRFHADAAQLSSRQPGHPPGARTTIVISAV